jgi:M6 family metalloprotease-like protein
MKEIGIMRSTNIISRSLGRNCKQGLLALAIMTGANLFSSEAAAVSAEPGLRSFPLDATGASFTAEVIGDEHFDYMKTRDGIIVVWNNASGAYEIAEVGQDASGATALLPSGTPVSSLTTYGGRVDPSSIPAIDHETLDALWEEAIARSGSSLPLGAGAPITTATTRPLLTILLEFTQSSTAGGTSSTGGFNGMFSTNIAYWAQTLHGSLPGSVNHYYNDMSLGQFSFGPAAETQGTPNDGIIRVRLPVPHPDSHKDYAELQVYLKQALSMANPFINFAAFDANNDGKVRGDELNVLFVVAGYESSNSGNTPSVWAHALGFYDPPTLDGKILTGYATIGETQVHKINGVHTAVPATLGIIVHELGHAAVGLPDLYKGPTPMGAFCVMASGSWGRRDGEPSGTTPTAMSAWSRVKTGFVVPTEIQPGAPTHVIALAQSAGTELFNTHVDPTIFKIHTSDPNSYFLIDNRQNEGYDSGLQRWVDFSDASGGLGVYRVDESRSAGAGKIAMMASNSASPAGIGDLYSKEMGNVFTPFSDPSSDDGRGGFTGLSLTDISGAGPIMFATIGYEGFDCNAITATIREHEIHGRAQKHVWNNFFLGYLTTGAQASLGLDKNAMVTLHAEAPGMWSVGDCP